MTDNEFDIKIREMLSDAVGEVPEGTWEGISDALDKAAAKKKRIVPVFWWRLSAGLAVAAAVVLAVVLWPVPKGQFAVTDKETPTVAVVTEPDPSDAVPNPVSDPVETPTGSTESFSGRLAVTRSAPVTASESVRPSSVPASSSGDSQTVSSDAVSSDIVGQETVSVEANGDGQPAVNETVQGTSSGPYIDPFADPVKVRQPHRIVLSASGNAIAGIKTGSSSSDRSGIQHAPARFKAPAQTGVSQAGGTSMYGLPVTAGLGVRYYVTPRLSLGTGCDYTFLFRRFSGTYNEVATPEGGSPEVVRSVTSDVIYNDQHFLGVPLTLYYDFLQKDRLRLYVHGGGEIEKCVKSHYRIPGGSEVISFSEKVKGVQWSVGAGVGLEVKLSRHLGFYVDPTLKYYFKGTQPPSLRTVQPLMVDVNAGFRFDIP
ncbi:MAG: outer membrane beta-barrel protein [Bacteroidales bacterium]|nr:outer membrane beta-barrel protein [Bacteroidales bacterium]